MTESSYNLEEQVQILSLTACIVQFLLTTELVVDQTVNDLGALLLAFCNWVKLPKLCK